eukprot:TRINITY_DN2025_c0_g1_i1.p1 TRINITY_DN2025_c0_g1~~TRINITY_DN2025_c0_g1_i1.p1  ORF type:complete len:311 (+),score=32.02 TRINITY_DN2025_c0_g1_i1:75-935(+)
MKIAAYVFMCSESTFDECIKGNLFGMPLPRLKEVQHIHTGTILFLYNFSTKRLYGIFQAQSKGQFMVNEKAWTQAGIPQSPYPAQVKVRRIYDCPPLEETQFRSILFAGEQKRKFRHVLSKQQRDELLKLFRGNAEISQPLRSSRSSNRHATNVNGPAEGVPVGDQTQVTNPPQVVNDNSELIQILVEIQTEQKRLADAQENHQKVVDKLLDKIQNIEQSLQEVTSLNMALLKKLAIDPDIVHSTKKDDEGYGKSDLIELEHYSFLDQSLEKTFGAVNLSQKGDDD